jgi:hypothetical protein
MKKLDLDSPLDLPNPRLNHSELQESLEKRALEHKNRDQERKLNSERESYYNGTLFGKISKIPPEEQDENWTLSVTPSKEYLANPRLAGSAWKHQEVRYMDEGGDSK